jgi:hypothetical protein
MLTYSNLLEQDGSWAAQAHSNDDGEDEREEE